MSSQEIMQEINRLLDDIVTRTLEINRKNASSDTLLDIDLAKDDIRHLYRRLEMLRGIISERARLETPSETASPKKEMTTSGPTHEGRPAAVRQPEPAPPQEPAHTPEQQAPANAPENEEKTPDSDQASLESCQEPGPDHPEESHARHEQTNKDISRKNQEPKKSHAQSESPESVPESEPLADQQPNEPAAPQEPVKEDKQAPSPPQPKAKNNDGKRAVIDILSEYSDRTIGDTYLKEQDDSLHKRISGDKEDKSIGERMQKQPIANLKDAIGVNEKFLFINELFDGDIQDYQEAIARLNEMEDARAAFDYLNTLGVEHTWDATRSADTIEKLVILVHRRHL